jgi:outer membrane protein assembly factor BamB
MVAGLLTFTTSVQADTAGDWPRWRGADGSGIVSAEAFNAASITPSPKVRWEAELGKGYSAASVAGHYVYTMGNVDDRDVVYCLRADTGKEVWRHTYACKGKSYPGPRSTPSVTGGLVFTLSRDGLVHALNAKTGAVVWKRDVASACNAGIPRWGVAGSPIIQGEALLLNMAEHGVALNARTGKTLWKSPAGTGGYSTPVVATVNGKRMVILFGEKHVYGVDLQTGRKHFSYPWNTKYNVNAADPVVIDQSRIFISSGYGRGSALLDVSGRGPKVVWENTNLKSHFGTCILIDDHLYGTDGNTGKGQLACIDVNTGGVSWREKLDFGSLIAAGKTLIYLNERGDLHVAKATPAAYTSIAKASGILSRICWTMPVLCRGSLYLRNDKGHLVCLNVR